MATRGEQAAEWQWLPGDWWQKREKLALEKPGEV